MYPNQPGLCSLLKWVQHFSGSFFARIPSRERSRISHLGKRKIIDSKIPLGGDRLVCRRVVHESNFLGHITSSCLGGAIVINPELHRDKLFERRQYTFIQITVSLNDGPSIFYHGISWVRTVCLPKSVESIWALVSVKRNTCFQ